MKKLLLALSLVLALSAGSALAGPMAFGVRGGYASDANDAFFVGAHVKGLEISPRVALVPNVEVAFFDGATLISLDADAVYSFVDTDWSGYNPYVGGEAGLNIWKYDNVPSGFDDSESKLVVNGLVGLEKSLSDSKALMFELKIGLSDWSPDLKFTVGLTFM